MKEKLVFGVGDRLEDHRRSIESGTFWSFSTARGKKQSK
jgi:hypothetical protein